MCGTVSVEISELQIIATVRDQERAEHYNVNTTGTTWQVRWSSFLSLKIVRVETEYLTYVLVGVTISF